MIHDPLIKLRITRTAIWRYAAPGRHYLNQVYALRMLTISTAMASSNVPASPPKSDSARRDWSAVGRHKAA